MSKIRIDLEATLINGQSLTFQSPADCSQITGLIVYYPNGNGTTSKDFKFVDAHGVDVGSGTISLFAENVLVKVVLDIDHGKAYVQNADTNAYLEGRLAEAPKMQTGTYQGTGKSGSSNPTSLTFDFVPTCVIILGSSTRGYNTSCIMMPALAMAVICENTNSRYVRCLVNFTIKGTTISWYSSASEGANYTQMNDADTTYRYVAFA